MRAFLFPSTSLGQSRAEGLLTEDPGNEAKIFNLYLCSTDILSVAQLCMALYSRNERVPITVGYQPLAQGTFGRASLDHSSLSSSATGCNALPINQQVGIN